MRIGREIGAMRQGEGLSAQTGLISSWLRRVVKGPSARKVTATMNNAIAIMPNIAPAPCWFNTGSNMKGNAPLTIRDNE